MSELNINNDWRIVASTIYKKPVDSKVFGTVEVDVTDAEAFIAKRRKEGIKTTLTHCFTLAFSRGIKAECPEFNTYVRRGRIVMREHIEPMISVLLKGGEMGSVKVPDADTFTLEELAVFLKENIKDARSGRENTTMKKKGMIASIPWPFRVWLFRLIKLFTVSWGISMPGIGLSANSFGSFVITNIGSIGLDVGFPALFPTANVSMVVTLGGINKKPVIINDEIVIRRIMTIGAALDHRVVDAVHMGKLFRYIKNIIRNPELLEKKL